MKGSRGMGRLGLHSADDRVGMEFQGKVAGASALPGVQEVIDKGIIGVVPPNPSHRGKRGVGEGEQ